MSKLADVLERAAARLDYGWCKHVLAKDEDGFNADPDDPNAAMWCAWGALYKEAETEKLANTAGDFLRNILAEKCNCAHISACVHGDISVFNDEAEDVSEVADFLRLAAKRAALDVRVTRGAVG